MTGKIFARLRGLFGHQRSDLELDEELRFHLEMQAEDNMRAGMPADQARREALRSFGGVAATKEAYRDQRSYAVLESAVRDFRYALRGLWRHPSFAVASIATLALAMGANTALFSVLDTLLLRPLPYPSPEQLVMLWTEAPSQSLREGRTAFGTVEDWRQQSTALAGIAVSDPLSATLMADSGAEQISLMRVSPNLFPMLGVQPVLGRLFSEQEAAERQRLALVSHRFWRNRLGGAEGVIGSSLEIDGVPSRVIGVLPDGFEFPLLNADVWEPNTLFPDWERRRGERGLGSWLVFARLRPQATIAQAQEEMTRIVRRLDEQLPESQRSRGISVVPLSLQITGPKQRLVLWMLAGAVFALLLIAVTNVAGLAVARAAARAKETAMRTALGASRVRLVSQFAIESLTIAAAAALVGLGIAHAGLRLLVAFAPGGISRLDQVSLDWRVLAWTGLLCLITGSAVALAPAFVSEPAHGLRTGAARIRGLLVTSQFAAAVVLVAVSGLLLRSLSAVLAVDPGFRPERVLSLQLSAAHLAGTAQKAEFYRRVIETTRAIPGVESAAIVSELFTGGGPERAVIAEGSAQAVSERLRLRSDEASGGFFQTLGTPLVAGRFFSPFDGTGTPVAIINESMARRLWPSGDAAGRRFRIADGGSQWFTVVGVTGDMRRQGVEIEPIPQMFEPLAQNPPRLATLLVRTAGADPLAMAGPVRAAIAQADRRAPVYGVTTLEHRLDASLAARRFQTWLLSGFSAIALLMAAMGIYGLIHYSVSARVREIGIRMAIGAQTAAIFRLTLAEGLRLSLIGLALGLAATVAISRAWSSLLFGVSAFDPLALFASALALLATAAVACFFPALRAMRIEPVTALRQG